MANDPYVIAAVAAGSLKVDPDTGAIHQKGTRCELPARREGLRVEVPCNDGKRRWAAAHRVVYIACRGLIPDGYDVRHRNHDRRDNRPANLYLLRRGQHLPETLAQIAQMNRNRPRKQQ